MLYWPPFSLGPKWETRASEGSMAYALVQHRGKNSVVSGCMAAGACVRMLVMFILSQKAEKWMPVLKLQSTFDTVWTLVHDRCPMFRLGLSASAKSL